MKLSLVAALLAGSWIARPAFAQPSAAAGEIAPAAPALAWPAREASVVREVEVGPWQLRWVGQFPIGEAAQEAAAGEALLTELGGQRSVLFEGEGSVLVRMPMGELSATARVAGKPAAAYVYISGSGAEEAALRVQRTWFALYEPKPRGSEREAEAGAKGLVVLLPGMFGTPEPVVDSLVGTLRGRGWHVLRMLTHPSRFTEKATYVLVPGGDVAGVAGEIAAEMNDRVGECALAVDAVCREIGESRPDVPVRRRIGLGLSGGGMVLSTVMASDPAAYAGAVFIGAGCDFARIAIESNYTDWIDSVRIVWQSEPSEETRAAFTEAYRAAAALDAYATAPILPDLPILMLHGEADEAVPAAMGDLLWERLGRPERWSQPIGHEALFLAYLPTRTGAVLDWLDERCAP